MFTSNARVAAARTAAENAKAQAADAFVALDDIQQSVTMVVDAFAGLDASAAGARLASELAPIRAAGDSASQGWIDALDKHAATLENRDADTRELNEAEAAFRSAEQALKDASTQLSTFQSRHTDIEGKVQQAWATIAPKTNAAKQALEDARKAAAEVAADGLSSASLSAKLVAAEQAAIPVNEGPHKHGVAATLRYCQQATAAANAVLTQAGQLKTLAEDTQRRLGSTQTRLDGVAARLEQVPPTLSSLRRQYSSGCSDDLDQIPAQATTAITGAREHLSSARTHAAAGRWENAAAELEQSRSNIAVAEAGVNAVVQRLRDLNEVAADPAEEKRRTRFAVRDAQVLVVSAGEKVSSNEAHILDTLAGRLDAVEAKLEGNHPDYWAYLVELRSIAELTSAVVRRTRAALAAKH